MEDPGRRRPSNRFGDTPRVPAATSTTQHRTTFRRRRIRAPPAPAAVRRLATRSDCVSYHSRCRTELRAIPANAEQHGARADEHPRSDASSDALTRNNHQLDRPPDRDEKTDARQEQRPLGDEDPVGNSTLLTGASAIAHHTSPNVIARSATTGEPRGRGAGNQDRQHRALVAAPKVVAATNSPGE